MRRREQLLKRLDTAWRVFKESFAGLSGSEMAEPGVTRTWSVKDIVAHVSTWEEEALKHLPGILAGERPPRYSVAYGGIAAFNAQSTERKRTLPVSEVLRQSEEIHKRLIDFLAGVPEEQLDSTTCFRRRLRLDTYGHYPKHAAAIVKWRERKRK